MMIKKDDNLENAHLEIKLTINPLCGGSEKRIFFLLSLVTPLV